MKIFDQRWQELAARARECAAPADGGRDVAVPHGFTTRVLARSAEVTTGGPSLEDLWLRCVRQSVALMAAVGVVLGTMDVMAGRSRELPHPGVENTVAQVLWRL
ncbi:MAG: hypothetical protein RIS76_460 [Verrucomicrobiota bacterium]|jgi:Ser/Thr protein kinase RdoA (MazF antagonist)